jgi:hypothetical protein
MEINEKKVTTLYSYLEYIAHESNFEELLSVTQTGSLLQRILEICNKNELSLCLILIITKPKIENNDVLLKRFRVICKFLVEVGADVYYKVDARELPCLGIVYKKPTISIWAYANGYARWYADCLTKSTLKNINKFAIIAYKALIDGDVLSSRPKLPKVIAKAIVAWSLIMNYENPPEDHCDHSKMSLEQYTCKNFLRLMVIFKTNVKKHLAFKYQGYDYVQQILHPKLYAMKIEKFRDQLESLILDIFKCAEALHYTIEDYWLIYYLHYRATICDIYNKDFDSDIYTILEKHEDKIRAVSDANEEDCTIYYTWKSRDLSYKHDDIMEKFAIKYL